MEKVKQALQSLALDVIEALEIAVVYLLPAFIIAYYMRDPAYGIVVNILEIVLGSQIKKNFPDSPVSKIF